MRVVKVHLGNRSYEIKIQGGLLNRLGEECAALGFGRKCALVTDSNVAERYLAPARRALENSGFECCIVTIPAGEKAKNLKQVENCYKAFAGTRLERGSFVVALGGGVVGDLAGFAAATYLRGLPFVQVPTTLLSQVDSSVGGKTGVNLKAGKNLVGAFHQPRLVLCDLDTLVSLPEREYRSGLAEVIKYGIIRDRSLFERLERCLSGILQKNFQTLEGVIARCCEIKADVVGADETETGVRAILNFGHTVGHALEATSGYGKFLHGEAISIGMVVAGEISSALLRFPAQEAARLRQLLKAAGLPIRTTLSIPASQKLIAAMALDKKVSGGEPKFVLARKLGKVEAGLKVPLPVLQAALATVSKSARG